MAMRIEPELDNSPPIAHDDAPTNGTEPARQPRASYAPPSLTRYGTLRELTKGGSGSNADGANHTKKN
jgi:hypothetical protein